MTYDDEIDCMAACPCDDFARRLTGTNVASDGKLMLSRDAVPQPTELIRAASAIATIGGSALRSCQRYSAMSCWLASNGRTAVSGASSALHLRAMTQPALEQAT